MTKGWERFEHDVARWFGLSTTISSGNKFFDPGDAVTRGRRHPWPLYADAKHTTRASFSLKLKDLLDYHRQALELGKNFILPVRFEDPYGVVNDYVVLPLSDFRELYEKAVG